MRVTQLWRYAVKSFAGTPVTSLDVEPWGPVGDRRWAVVDPTGRPYTARTLPGLLRMRAEPTTAGLRLQSPVDGLDVDTPVDGPGVAVGFSRQPPARDAGDGAAAYLTRVLGTPVRLVWQPDPRARSVNPGNGGLPGEALSLADAGPLLLVSEASLARLSEWAGIDLDIRRFRPNVVTDGAVPFEEDGWPRDRNGGVDTWLQMGGLAYRVQFCCDRCAVTLADPDTLVRGKEPLRTLARHRKWDGKTWFGVWLVPVGRGVLRVGDSVLVSETAPAGATDHAVETLA